MLLKHASHMCNRSSKHCAEQLVRSAPVTTSMNSSTSRSSARKLTPRHGDSALLLKPSRFWEEPGLTTVVVTVTKNWHVAAQSSSSAFCVLGILRLDCCRGDSPPRRISKSQGRQLQVPLLASTQMQCFFLTCGLLACPPSAAIRKPVDPIQ